ncbi:crAss001_48 related protein [Streptococcus catagoni]|uniref:crAss001_48 related protein n=1 Tax=Streptococcus catagoni TaxID=2654874 RepID=UPI0014090109|nr:hypothetical protein [Streptococcus catagoni]
MEEYEKRMVTEYKELKSRAEKLSVIINRYYLDSLDFELKCPIELLLAQWHAMGAYLKILEQRAAIEKINLDSIDHDN